jgi:hypothetical protein
MSTDVVFLIAVVELDVVQAALPRPDDSPFVPPSPKLNLHAIALRVLILRPGYDFSFI